MQQNITTIRRAYVKKIFFFCKYFILKSNQRNNGGIKHEKTFFCEEKVLDLSTQFTKKKFALRFNLQFKIGNDFT